MAQYLIKTYFILCIQYNIIQSGLELMCVVRTSQYETERAGNAEEENAYHFISAELLFAKLSPGPS